MPAGLALYTRFNAQPGTRGSLVQQLLQAARLMEGAAGCELYLVNTSPADETTVWVTELWEDEEQHRASLSLEGVPALIQATMPLLAGPPEQIRLTPAGGKGPRG